LSFTFLKLIERFPFICGVNYNQSHQVSFTAIVNYIAKQLVDSV